MTATAVSFSDATEETPEVPPVPVALNANDRCDKCGAQAYTRWTLESGLDLLFCYHDGNEAEAGLLGKGFIMTTDERAKLTPNKLQGSDH